ANMVQAGLTTIGFDIVAKRRKDLERAGGEAASSVADLSRRAPMILTSLPSPHALLTVAREIAASKGAAKIVIETSTLAIADKEEARALLENRGVTLLDCPLSGTGAQARTRDLVVLASGPRAAFRRCVPVFEGFARSSVYLGEFGNGTKM